MENRIRENFLKMWEKYFPGATLPLTYFYSNENRANSLVRPSKKGHACFLAELNRALEGEDLCFDSKSFACHGGHGYCGYSTKKMKNFEFFLSCGIEGELEGERYKRTPELARKFINRVPKFQAPADYLIFKRWDKITEEDNPEMLVFFATPDVLAGLYTLANFEEESETAVTAPFSSGCASIITLPYSKKYETDQKAYLGMFDVSARPSVPADTLTFTVTMDKMEQMLESAEESFLITESWKPVAERICERSRQ